MIKWMPVDLMLTWCWRLRRVVAAEGGRLVQRALLTALKDITAMPTNLLGPASRW
jgi:hypothetical protein